MYVCVCVSDKILASRYNVKQHLAQYIILKDSKG